MPLSPGPVPTMTAISTGILVLLFDILLAITLINLYNTSCFSSIWQEISGNYWEKDPSLTWFNPCNFVSFATLRNSANCGLMYPTCGSQGKYRSPSVVELETLVKYPVSLIMMLWRNSPHHQTRQKHRGSELATSITEIVTVSYAFPVSSKVRRAGLTRVSVNF